MSLTSVSLFLLLDLFVLYLHILIYIHFYFFKEVFEVWNCNIIRFCVCYHCCHDVLQYDTLLENVFNSVFVD